VDLEGLAECQAEMAAMAVFALSMVNPFPGPPILSPAHIKILI
jgi:hypothetical protein